MQGPGPGCGSGEIEKENCSRIHELRNRTTVHFWMQQMKEKNNIDIVKIVYKEQSSKLKAFKIVELGLGRYEVGNVIILKWKTLEAAPEEEKEHSFPNDTKQA